ncbi:hypothetical protein [Planktothrix sp. FACHB-1355]|nr:hypothetical protein [Planktothrix sp. FACHB-1355]
MWQFIVGNDAIDCSSPLHDRRSFLFSPLRCIVELLALCDLD